MDILKELFGTCDELHISKTLFGGDTSPGQVEALTTVDHSPLRLSNPLPLLPAESQVASPPILSRSHSMVNLASPFPGPPSSHGRERQEAYRSDVLRSQSVFPQFSGTTAATHVELPHVPREMPMYLLQEDEGNEEEILRLLSKENTPLATSPSDFSSPLPSCSPSPAPSAHGVTPSHPPSTAHGVTPSHPPSSAHGVTPSHPPSSTHGVTPSHPPSTTHGVTPSHPPSSAHGVTPSHPPSTAHGVTTSHSPSTAHGVTPSHPPSVTHGITTSHSPSTAHGVTTSHPPSITYNVTPSAVASEVSDILELCSLPIPTSLLHHVDLTLGIAHTEVSPAHLETGPTHSRLHDGLRASSVEPALLRGKPPSSSALMVNEETQTLAGAVQTRTETMPTSTSGRRKSAPSPSMLSRSRRDAPLSPGTGSELAPSLCELQATPSGCSLPSVPVSVSDATPVQPSHAYPLSSALSSSLSSFAGQDSPVSLPGAGHPGTSHAASSSCTSVLSLYSASLPSPTIASLPSSVSPTHTTPSPSQAPSLSLPSPYIPDPGGHKALYSMHDFYEAVGSLLINQRKMANAAVPSVSDAMALSNNMSALTRLRTTVASSQPMCASAPESRTGSTATGKRNGSSAATKAASSPAAPRMGWRGTGGAVDHRPALRRSGAEDTETSRLYTASLEPRAAVQPSRRCSPHGSSHASSQQCPLVASPPTTVESTHDTIVPHPPSSSSSSSSSSPPTSPPQTVQSQTPPTSHTQPAWPVPSVSIPLSLPVFNVQMQGSHEAPFLSYSATPVQLLPGPTAAEGVTAKPKKRRHGGGWPKGKKRKAVIDTPQPPKLPSTGYALFLSEKLPELQQELKTPMMPTLSRKAGSLWGQLNTAEKKMYYVKAEKDRQRYLQQLKDYLRQTQRGHSSASLEAVDVLVERVLMAEEEDSVLRCYVCRIAFHSLHNKRSHYLGRQHSAALLQRVGAILQGGGACTPKEGRAAGPGAGKWRERNGSPSAFQNESESDVETRQCDVQDSNGEVALVASDSAQLLGKDTVCYEDFSPLLDPQKQSETGIVHQDSESNVALPPYLPDAEVCTLVTGSSVTVPMATQSEASDLIGTDPITTFSCTLTDCGSSHTAGSPTLGGAHLEGVAASTAVSSSTQLDFDPTTPTSNPSYGRLASPSVCCTVRELHTSVEETKNSVYPEADLDSPASNTVVLSYANGGRSVTSVEGVGVCSSEPRQLTVAEQLTRIAHEFQAQVHALEDAQNREAEQLDRNAALRRECSEIEVLDDLLHKDMASLCGEGQVLKQTREQLLLSLAALSGMELDTILYSVLPAGAAEEEGEE